MADEFLVNFLRLLFVINPLVLIPIFQQFRLENKNDNLICMVKAIFLALIILTGFGIFGTAILKFIGISTYSFSIAGGSLLIILGINLMMTGNALPLVSDEKKRGTCFVPMGTPFIAGPGAITATMLMAQNDTSKFYNIPIFTSLTIIFVLFITLLILFLSADIPEYLKERQKDYFMDVIAKIMGIFITAIGVEFIVNGISGFIHTL
jgi:multiple antibiotic resistance protein